MSRSFSWLRRKCSSSRLWSSFSQVAPVALLALAFSVRSRPRCAGPARAGGAAGRRPRRARGACGAARSACGTPRGGPGAAGPRPGPEQLGQLPAQHRVEARQAARCVRRPRRPRFHPMSRLMRAAARDRSPRWRNPLQLLGLWEPWPAPGSRRRWATSSASSVKRGWEDRGEAWAAGAVPGTARGFSRGRSPRRWAATAGSGMPSRSDSVFRSRRRSRPSGILGQDGPQVGHAAQAVLVGDGRLAGEGPCGPG